jgi:hypothetical protein
MRMHFYDAMTGRPVDIESHHSCYSAGSRDATALACRPTSPEIIPRLRAR